jgi:hypothetical protein
MALQPNSGPGLPFWGFVTITFLQGWIVSPAPTPNPQPGGPGLRIYDPRRQGGPAIPQGTGTMLVNSSPWHDVSSRCRWRRWHSNMKGKVKYSSPATRHGGALVERRYSSDSFTTSTLDGVSDQCHAPAALYPRGKDPLVPIGQEAGWVPEPVWTQRLEEKYFASAGDRTPIARSSSP